MKSAAEKSSATSTTVTQPAQQPFIARAGRGDFLAPAQAAAPAVQMKMEVNKPGDKFEQEADKMADNVIRMPTPPAPGKEELQRQPEEKVQKKEDDKLQKAQAPEEKLQREGSGGAPAVSNVQSAIRDQTAGGEPLPANVRDHMEPRFNADFNNVRIHNDSESASLNDQLGARAFTYQNHIFFSRDRYQPGTSDGKLLLAHELTHTIQQGHAVQRQAEISPSVQSDHSAPAIQKAPAPAGASAPASSEVVNISSNIFSPSQKVKDEIEASRSKGLDVRVAVKGLTAEGRVKIKADRAKNYDSVGKGSMPLLNAWTQQLGGMHINFRVNNSEIKGGYASFKPEAGDQNDWLQALQKNSSVLGGLGLKIGQLPTVKNTFDGGKLMLGVTNLKVELGGFLDALFNVSVEDMGKPKIDATTDVNIKGAVKGQLKLDNSAGPLAGQLSLGVDYKSFSGFAIVKYNADGSIDINGKGAYNADKLSGEIHFVSTDLETANRFTKDAIAAAGGKENIQDAGPPAPVPQPKAGEKKRALAATGQLAFHLTEWFAGTVHVIVDGKGAVTVIGRIAPPGEIRLFDQKDWDKELIKFEAKAYYGIPVVGDLNLFASISLHAIAKLGPAKIYNIEILGTYSTDPEIQKSIQISGSINISAYGGLKLNAEGGVGVEILDHDLKFGIAIHVDAGVKAYADARPTIGYRDPGVFYISGTLELVAQPVLGLGGEFFIALETPWWSPLSDDRWNWPLFESEWPLGDPMGISASVKDYELGSKKVPEIELKKPEFDPSKFMTSMVDKTLPGKSGAAGASQGAFKEDGTVPKPVAPPKKPPPKSAETKPPRKGTSPRGGKSATPGAGAAKAQQSTKLFQSAAKPLSALKTRGALARAELNQELAKIKAQVGGIDFGIQLKAEKWIVTPRAGGRSGRAVELSAKELVETDKAGKPDERTEAESKRDKLAAIAEAEKLLLEEPFDELAARSGLGPIKNRYRLLSLNLVVDSKRDRTETVHFTASASKEEVGKQKEVTIAKVIPVNADSWIKNLATGSYEQVIHSATVSKKTPSGEMIPLSFSTAKSGGGESTHSYKNEGIQWERSDFSHRSKLVRPLGSASFELKEFDKGRDAARTFIRDTLYQDSQSSRATIVDRKLAILNPTNLAYFLSEGDPSKEAAEGYKIDPASGKAIVPVRNASPDHDPPIADHWTNRQGNNIAQSPRESWNASLGTYKLMSLKLNLSLGSRGENYTKDVGISFRGPGE